MKLLFDNLTMYLKCTSSVIFIISDIFFRLGSLALMVTNANEEDEVKGKLVAKLVSYSCVSRCAH